MNAELTMDVARGACGTTHLPHPLPAGTEPEIVVEIHTALETRRLDLPPLPDPVGEIYNLLDDPNIPADRIAHLLSSDPAISMHIIGAANSAALSNGKPVNNLRSAISRLGYPLLRSLLMNIAMTRLFRARSPFVDQQMKELLEHSREVATNSYVLAQRQKHLKPEQAMLAGLVHDIGALPLYLYADRHQSRLDQATMEELMRRFSAVIGARLLQSWHFPDELIDVIAGHQDLHRISDSGVPDYVDVVTMANLQMPGTAKFIAWKNVPAAERLGYYSTDCRNFLTTHADLLAAVRGMLQIDGHGIGRPTQ